MLTKNTITRVFIINFFLTGCLSLSANIEQSKPVTKKQNRVVQVVNKGIQVANNNCGIITVAAIVCYALKNFIDFRAEQLASLAHLSSMPLYAKREFYIKSLTNTQRPLGDYSEPTQAAIKYAGSIYVSQILEAIPLLPATPRRAAVLEVLGSGPETVLNLDEIIKKTKEQK